MMCAAHGGEPDAFMHQDGQGLRKAPGLEPHAQLRWNDRAPPEWKGFNVRVAWREAEWFGRLATGTYARLHEPSRMLVICKWGFIASAKPLHYQQYEGDDGQPSENGQRRRTR